MPGEPIYCPNGHKIGADVWVMGDDYIVSAAKRCLFKWPPGNAGTCGAIVCWLTFKDGTRVVIEVTSSEAHNMEKMGTEERLEYLNLRSFHRTNSDEPPGAIARPPQSAGAVR
jgi:hypothetical protein